MTTKVIQWATGSVGKLQLQQVLRRPDLELVGVFCFGEDKVGRDAGDLCGLAKTGITATNDKAAIFAMDADVVLHAASKAHGDHSNDSDIMDLLASGKNVITTTSYNHLPSYGAALEQGFKDACAKGGASFYAAGENPGFMLERLTPTVSGICQHIENLVFDEFVLCADHPVKEMMFDLMGFGKAPHAVTTDDPMFKVLTQAYTQALNGAADQFGIMLERVEPSIEVDTLGQDLQIACGTVKAGTISGQCLTWTGYWRGRAFITINEIWLLSKDTDRWGVRQLANYTSKDYYRLQITGKPSVTLEMGLDMPSPVPDRLRSVTAATYIMIANTAVAAIDAVLKAPPGVLIAPVFAAYQPEKSEPAHA